MKDLGTILNDFQSEIQDVHNEDDLNRIKGKYVGRKSVLNDFFQEMKTLSPDEKKDIGQKINELKSFIEKVLMDKTRVMEQEKKTKNRVDVTLPGKKQWSGSFHPIIMTMYHIVDIFQSLGFRVETGPEIETDYYNFEALNFPPDHPARDAQDSFFLGQGYLLRTHTSPAQVRIMEKTKPPFKVVIPGKCYRRDPMDASHSLMFHQIEGLVVANKISMGDLKGTIEIFAHRFFGADRRLRFRPSFFPFTEPSAEVDVSCGICGGKGCRSCGHSGWLEVMGAGLVHPNVFRSTGYNPQEVRGFAFGMGVERSTLLKFGVPDMRWFYENDMSFLEQFKTVR
ncbi:MAG: phenylalanine--tRNA ligase subunit alpha [Candidatus Atribacteria bacterium]|nr:phenylalanine--tRNA ligase subunit alpha [Candidatus Atribacteria bacterium]